MTYSNDYGTGTTMLVQPSGYGMYGGNGGLFGGNGDSWLGILFLIALCNGGFGGIGGFGGYGAMMAGGWDLYPWLNQSNQINDGFRDQMMNTTITGIQNSVTSGFGDVQTALCGGFAGVNATVNNAQNAITQQMYTNQISDLERSFAAQTALTQNLNGIQTQIGSEGCQTRATIAAGNQSILDKLCQLELDGYKREIEAKNDTIAQLRSQVSTSALNNVITKGFSDEVDQLYNRLANCPVPSTPVYGRTPIFTCAQNVANNCGCNNGFATVG